MLIRLRKYILRSKDGLHYIRMYNRISGVKYATTNLSYVAYRLERGKAMVQVQIINTGQEQVTETIFVPEAEMPRILKDLGFAV